jgi:hypothetical protein
MRAKSRSGSGLRLIATAGDHLLEQCIRIRQPEKESGGKSALVRGAVFLMSPFAGIAVTTQEEAGIKVLNHPGGVRK